MTDSEVTWGFTGKYTERSKKFVSRMIFTGNVSMGQLVRHRLALKSAGGPQLQQSGPRGPAPNTVLRINVVP